MTFLPRPQDKLIPVGDRTISVIERGEGGQPLIFLHGGGPGGNSWLDFSPVLEYFPDRRAIFLDLPQYGGSSKEPIVGQNWSYHAKYIVGTMDALGIDKADFAGGSVGCTAALAVAANYPERVRRLVSAAASPPQNTRPSEHQYTIGSKVVTPLYEGGPTLEKNRDADPRCRVARPGDATAGAHPGPLRGYPGAGATQ